MLASVGAQFRRGQPRGITSLLQAEQGIPEFEVLLNILDEGEQSFRHGGSFDRFGKIGKGRKEVARR